jgi:hypothetical protein
LLLAWFQIQGVETTKVTKALGPMVALGGASVPTAATGPMAFKVLRLALGWLHEVTKFDSVLLVTSSHDQDPIMTAVGAHFVHEKTVTSGDGSTRLCQFYSSLRPAAVRRVQAVGDFHWLEKAPLSTICQHSFDVAAFAVRGERSPARRNPTAPTRAAVPSRLGIRRPGVLASSSQMTIP